MQGAIMADMIWEEAVPALSKLSTADTSNLCHALAEQICHNRIPSPDAYLKTLSLEEYWAVTGAIRKFFTAAIKGDKTKDEMLECMQSAPQEQAKVIVEAATVHRDELRVRLLEDTTAISQCVLQDFDWQLKLVMSSDKLASVNEPLVNLDLDLREGSGESRQVTVELDPQDLKKLITSLEGCSKAVQQLTV